MFQSPCFFIFLIVLSSCVIGLTAQANGNVRCWCPPNEKPGDRKCNGCEPSCANPNPAFCTLMICPPCTCECVDGLVRDSISNKCVPKEQCP
ncbi:hypothetical protein niasHT_033293 [Heterodera trifolii]|uniref:Uncharacterized protein n=1 Tax=Heterodera trifolii TaxID=157864 RepID=A0ABD2IA46_9BILA